MPINSQVIIMTNAKYMFSFCKPTTHYGTEVKKENIKFGTVGILIIDFF